jgi:hypothetical protein
MKFKERDPEIHEEFSLSGVDPFIDNMNRLFEELRNKVKSLPQVDQEGHSECPFAEYLYAEKEKLTERVEKESKKLRPYLEVVEREIERCVSNLAQINADANSLFLDQAREEYARAKHAQELQYEKAVQQRGKLIGLIECAAKILAEARSKKFPTKKPGDSFQSPLGVFEGKGIGSIGETAGKTFSVQPSFKSEIDNLISLGPLGKRNESGLL